MDGISLVNLRRTNRNIKMNKEMERRWGNKKKAMGVDKKEIVVWVRIRIKGMEKEDEDKQQVDEENKAR